MAETKTLVIKSDSTFANGNGRIRVTYTAENGKLFISKLEGCRTDGYLSETHQATYLYISVNNGAYYQVNLASGYYVKFPKNSNYANWGIITTGNATTWNNLSGNSFTLKIKMPPVGSSTLKDKVFTSEVAGSHISMSLSTYTIKYNANGGTGAPANQTKTHGVNLTLSKTAPTRAGYIFKGWATSATGIVVNTPGGTYSGNASITYYAVWEKNTYTITYHANGGTGAPEAQTQNYGESITISSTIPTRASVTMDGMLINYIFKGWSTSYTATSANYSAGAVTILENDITLYAVWETDLSSNIYITYNTGSDSEIAPQIKTQGTTIKLSTEVPVKDGYTFTGWGTSLDGVGPEYQPGDSYTANADLILFAIWVAWKHTVSFDLNGGTENAPEDFFKFSDEDAIIPEIAPTRLNSRFKYWCTTSDGSGEIYHIGDGYNHYQNGGTVTLFAIWDNVTITFTDSGQCFANEFIEISDSEINPYFDFNASVNFYEIIEGDEFNLTKSKFSVKEIIER